MYRPPRPTYGNTLMPDSDLVYVRAPETDASEDGLVEIAFEDMEPIEGFDVIGVEPHTAIAISPVAEFDCIGVAPYGAIAATPVPPFGRGVLAELDPDGCPTEEYSRYDDEPEAAALG